MIEKLVQKTPHVLKIKSEDMLGLRQDSTPSSIIDKNSDKFFQLVNKLMDNNCEFYAFYQHKYSSPEMYCKVKLHCKKGRIPQPKQNYTENLIIFISKP